MELYNNIGEVSAEEVNLNSFKVKSDLNPNIWVNNKINSNVRLRLLDLAQDFYDTLSVKWIKPIDVVITGSLANYNWSDYSDIDVHIIVDYNDVYKDSDFVKDYFDAKKDIWNETHEDITIYGFPVEMYVEDLNTPANSSGVYSLLTNEWLKEPKDLDDARFNHEYVKEVSAKYMTLIDSVSEKADKENDRERLLYYLNKLEHIFDKLKDKRKKGLSTEAQEMSSGNIIWKVLRREGYLDKICDCREDIYNRIKSIF